jgi:hypothetical protein
MSFNFLRGLGGELEIGRLYLAGSGLAGILTPIGFQSWDMAANGAHFDVTAWCVAYPSGLAALGALGIFTIGKKDKGVAEAKATLKAAEGQ